MKGFKHFQKAKDLSD